MAAIVSDWLQPLSVPQRLPSQRVDLLEEFRPVLPVVAPQALTYVLEAELGGFNKGWTNISADVNLGVEQLTIEYGIMGGGPLDRVANVGTMAWAMKNSVRNSGGLLGYYTPGHSNARSGWELGIRVRFKVGFLGIWYYKFIGSLVDASPDTGTFRRRAVTCIAHDWMDEALNTFIRDTPVQTNKRSDEIVATLVTGSARRQPTVTAYNEGQSTFAYALDNMRDERTTLLRALADVAYSEVGYLYVKGDNLQGGTLKFEDRHARPKATSKATFTNSMFEMSVTRSRDDILNHVNAVVHPRKVDAEATTVVYELTSTETSPRIASGQSLPLTVFFRDATGRFARVGATDVVTPVAGTDYIGNTAADGSGSVVTGSLSLSFSFTSNSATLIFTNNSAADIYLTTLQVRGKVIADRYELSVFKHNEASEEAYGEHDISYDMVYDDRPDYALGVCDWFLSLYGSPRMSPGDVILKASSSDAALMTQVLAREPGDKITVTEAMAGLAASKFFINGVRLRIRPGGLMESGWVLAPADQQQAWLLEDAQASLLETSTYLGFL